MKTVTMHISCSITLAFLIVVSPCLSQDAQQSSFDEVKSELQTTPVGERGKLIPALLHSMSDDTVEQCRTWTFMGEGLRDFSAISALVAAVPTRDGKKAAALLAGAHQMWWFSLSQDDVDSLLPCFDCKDAEVRRDIASILSAASKLNDTKAQDALMQKLLNDPDEKVRANCASSLGSIGSEESFKKAEPTANALGNALAKDSSPNVREECLFALAAMKGKAAPAANAVVQSLTDTSKSVRMRAMQAIEQIGAPCSAAVPELIRVLKNPDDYYGAVGSTHAFACQALGAIGAKAAEAVPAMVSVLQEEYSCCVAVRALGQIGPEAKPAIPALLRVLASANCDHRQAAAEALGEIGPAAESALTQLEWAAHDERDSHKGGNPNGAMDAAQKAIEKIKFGD